MVLILATSQVLRPSTLASHRKQCPGVAVHSLGKSRRDWAISEKGTFPSLPHELALISFTYQGPWPVVIAINEFKKQFRAKAGVAWENRVGMIPQKGMRLACVSYTRVEP